MSDKYKSLKITEYAHMILKGYADENSLNMSKWVSNLIINYIKDGLPDSIPEHRIVPNVKDEDLMELNEGINEEK